MPSIWSIKYGNQTKPVSDWGLVGLKLNLISQGIDTLDFLADGYSLELPEIFPYGAIITLIDPVGVAKFVGTVIETPASGDGKGESRKYTAVGPWWNLDNLVYQFRWKYYVLQAGVWTATDRFSPILILGLDFNGANMSTREQILDVLDYAQTIGVNILTGNVLPNRAVAPIKLLPPPDEVRDITCAEAIKKMLRWHPDAVTWWDYTTVKPTLHVRIKEDLTPVNVTVPLQGKGQAHSTITVQSISARPRYDLKRDVVAITFISRGSINGQNQIQSTSDIFPINATGREQGALALSVDLQGAKIQTLTVPVETIARDFTQQAYWKETIPELSDPRVDATTITGPTLLTRSGASNFPNELLNGAVADWMVLPNGTPVGIEEDVIASKFSFLIYVDKAGADGKVAAKLMEDKIDHVFSVRRKMTNAVTGIYTTLESFEGADLIPVGLAQYLYNSLHPLAYEGELTQVEDYNKGSVSIGNVVNVPSSKMQLAWGTMNALVQRVTMDIDIGTTRVSFGPPPHLTAGDIIDLLKVGRQRQRFTNRLSRSTGLVKGGSLDLPKYTEATDTVPGGSTLQKLRVKAGAAESNVLLDGVAGKITGNTVTAARSMILSGDELTITDGAKGINAKTADCVGGNAARTLTVREVEVCVNNVTKHMLVIGSVSY